MLYNNELSKYICQMKPDKSGVFPPEMDTEDIQKFVKDIDGMNANFDKESIANILMEVKDRHGIILETQKILENKAYINIGVLGILLNLLMDFRPTFSGLTSALLQWSFFLAICLLNLISMIYAYNVLIVKMHRVPDNRYNIAIINLPIKKVLLASIIQYFRVNTINKEINQKKCKALMVSTKLLIIDIWLTVFFVLL